MFGGLTLEGEGGQVGGKVGGHRQPALQDVQLHLGKVVIGGGRMQEDRWLGGRSTGGQDNRTIPAWRKNWYLVISSTSLQGSAA